MLLRLLLCALLVIPAPVLASGRLFTSASSESASIDTAVVTAPPFTAYGCFRRATSGGGTTNIIWGVADKDTASHYHMLYSNAADDPSVITGGTGGPGIASIITTLAADTWYRMVGTWGATNDRDVFFQGSTVGNTTTVTTNVIDRTFIGAELDSSPSNYFNGDIAWVVVWNVVLTAAEISALESGAHPMRIRPISRVGAWPMWAMHSPEINIGSQGFSLTLTGTTATTGGGCSLPPWSGR